MFSLSFLPRFSGKQAADGLFRFYPAEVAQVDGILRLALAAIDHFVPRCVGKHLLHQKATKGTVDLPEGQCSGLPIPVVSDAYPAMALSCLSGDVRSHHNSLSNAE